MNKVILFLLVFCLFVFSTGSIAGSHTQINELEYDLQQSQIDKTEYDRELYNCHDFTVDLAEELKLKGYNAGRVVLDTCNNSTDNHEITWVKFCDNYVYVDPQTDNFVSCFDDKYKKHWIINSSNGDVVEVLPC